MRIGYLVAMMAALPACSVGMAARTGGVKAEEITQCQSRECFIAEEKMEIIEVSKRDDGSFSETYKFQIKRGSAGRAAMHGLLDVATLGIWEVAGTPIEATKKKKYILITADYDAQGKLLRKSLGATAFEDIDSAEIDLPEGSKVYDDDGRIRGVVTPEGDFVKIEDLLTKESNKANAPTQ
jgi:5S rRNA maturation endonuclease (ribonuclease M5)